MARDDDDLDLDVETPAKGSGKLWKIMFFVMIGILIIGISIGLTLFLVSGSGDSADAGGDGEVAAESKSKAKARKEEVEEEEEEGATVKQITYIEVKPPIVVNPNDPETEFTYLRVGVSILVSTDKEKELVELHMPSIRHNLVMLFGDQKFSTLMTSEGKRELQKQALEVAQAAMKAATKKSVVQDLYITDLVGQ